MQRLPPAFWCLVDKAPPLRFGQKEGDACWLWKGPVRGGGFGQYWLDGQTWYVHELVYVTHIGPLPRGEKIRQRCHARHCLRPEHLGVPVVVRDAEAFSATQPERPVRAPRTACLKDHPLTPENVYITPAGRRRCRICNRAAKRNAYARKTPPRLNPTRCKWGHLYDRPTKFGKRCSECLRGWAPEKLGKATRRTTCR